MEETETHKPNVSRLALFLAFSRISLSSFGGAIFWARRELIERQRWITEREFVEMFTLGQLLPGPNVLNVTVMFGYRFAGWTGAAAAVALGRTSFCGCGHHALAAAVGHGRSRAMGCRRGLERAATMNPVDLGGLFLHFLILWFLAIGGPSTIFPDILRYVVDVHHLLTNAEFAEIYTLAQVAPGPNAMYVTLIGWHLAGWMGVAATTIPLLIPATTLTLLVGHLNERYPNAPIGYAIRRGLTPITIGLVFASSTILMRAVNHDWRGYLITLLTVAVVLRKSLNPLWLFAGGALAGILGFV